jgi:hypothetical protein
MQKQQYMFSLGCTKLVTVNWGKSCVLSILQQVPSEAAAGLQRIRHTLPINSNTSGVGSSLNTSNETLTYSII